METLNRYGDLVVDWFHPFYTDDGSPQDARLQMHVEDYDAGRWTEGEPAFLRMWKARFFRKVSREYMCDACKLSFPRTHFAMKMLDNATSLGRKLVCFRCQEDGFSPKDCNQYSCAGSIFGESHVVGHLAFAPESLSKWKRGYLALPLCKACQARDACKTSTDNVMKKAAAIIITSKCMKRPAREGTEKLYKCDACQKLLTETLFRPLVLKNARQHGRKLVCMACAEDGYSPKDCRKYRCLHGEYRGHLKFKPQTLGDSKRRKRYQPTCIPCGQRKELLLKKLYSRGSWRCKCPKERNWSEKRLKLSRHHWFAEAWMRTTPHELRCPLYPQVDGEKRWEGKNKGLTEEDVKFLLVDRF